MSEKYMAVWADILGQPPFEFFAGIYYNGEE
jgi:hypothetical protein